MHLQLLHPVFSVAGMLVGLWLLSCNKSKSYQLTDAQKWSLGLAAVFGSLIGSKLPFLLGSVQHSAFLFWLTDGKTILAGIVGGYLAVEITKITMGIHHRTGDQFALPCAVAIGLGRVGCFFGGCCFGTQTDLPWGIGFELSGDASVLRHPTQIYEALFHFGCAIGILYLEKRNWFPRRRLVLYLGGYLIFRFFTEWIRPETIALASMTYYQIACVGLLPALLAVDRFAEKRFLRTQGEYGVQKSISTAKRKGMGDRDALC